MIDSIVLLKLKILSTKHTDVSEAIYHSELLIQLVESIILRQHYLTTFVLLKVIFIVFVEQTKSEQIRTRYEHTI